ncbi:hypothetical protein TKK_0015427 [Trichogramma kaykai]|uniref:Transposable element P transposase n=1 Tax=Trichogramma kaykai TaxID=54128 RepID=A0ABD2WAD4_9HYME
MKVRFATQIFSHSVGAALMTAATTGELGKDFNSIKVAVNTSDFCTRINRIFDCLNARTPYDSNPYRKGLSEKPIVREELENSIGWLEKIDLLDCKSFTVKNLILTIKGILIFWESLRAEGIHYVLTSRLNQDKLEIFFGFLRERCGYNNNPTLTHCVKNIQYAVLVTLLVPSSGTNCEADTARLLISNFNSIISTESQNVEDLINKELESWYISDDLHHNDGDHEQLKDHKKDKNKDNNKHDDNDDDDDQDEDDNDDDQDEDDDDDDTKQLIKIPRLKITELVEPKLFEHAKTYVSGYLVHYLRKKINCDYCHF